MDSNRKTARIVGVLFIISTVAGILCKFFLGPILNAPDFLINVSANENQLIIGALLLLIMAAAIFAIPVMLFPILKKHNEKIALGYLVARIFEAVPIVVGVISLVSLSTLSQEFLIAGATNTSYFQTLGTLLLAARNWTDLIGTQIVFSLTALILNYSLYQSKLIPRSISIWGLIGAPLIFAAGLLGMFGLVSPFSTIAIFLYLPIASQEMVFALWLIIKGFNSSAINTGFSKTNTALR
ncbi:MAG: DUF4386 domain-containing protein [Methanosarcinales archaeon]|nr:DUF4386 domain-containing protein [Methanosarcinales archaeon]